MSFGAQFLAGQKFAQGLIETYRDAKQRRELDEIANAKPVESEGFTAADGDQMRAMATAINPETGKSYYDIQDNGQGGLQVRNNFAYEGQDGTTVEPGSTTALQPKRVTDFLGQRYEGGLGADRLDSLRYRAAADVIGKDDPVRGMQMRRDLKQGEREDKRFTWEEQAQPLKQRGLELAASAGERTERQGQRSDDIQKLDDAIAQMPREALEIYASKLNTNGSQYPMLYTGKTKDGFKFITTDPDSGKPTGKEFVLNEAQLRQIAGASVLSMAGYGQESMTRLSSVNKDIADYVKTWNDTQAKVATSHNDAEKLSIEREKLGVQRAEAGAKQAYYNRASQSLREFVDPKGNSVLVDVASLPRGKDGTLELPQGLRPKAARPEVSQSDVVNYAKALVEADTPDPDAPKTKLTLDKALVIARAQLGGEGYKSAADKLVEAYMTNRGKTQPEEKPAPVGVVKPPRQITTIVPPRTAADINPKPRMTDEEIIKLLSGM